MKYEARTRHIGFPSHRISQKFTILRSSVTAHYLICCQHRNTAVVFLGTWNPGQRVASIGLSFKARLIMMDTWMVFARINSSFNMSLPHVKASEIGGLAQLVYFDGYLPYQGRYARYPTPCFHWAIHMSVGIQPTHLRNNVI
jgi:hypothetical protein